MSPRSAGVLCLLAVLLCCCIKGSFGAKKTREELLAQVDDVVKNLKTMNSKRELGSEGISRSSLGQLYMTEMEIKRALLGDPDDLDLQEAMRELKSLEKEVHKGITIEFWNNSLTKVASEDQGSLDLASQTHFPVVMAGKPAAKDGKKDERNYKGRIAHMQVYNIALTQEQIKEAMERTKGGYD
uniref:Uncharacterized protein n=1 Tax=Branchiostoma floridae TaxID=7739 RepID=C3ZFK6_BRAFL|eukprot:XP_002592749.1 hypothetical protein BRAFLDRAFT_130827 [Branchiostoma floridae]